MNGVDWIITGAVVLLALLGYSQGFLAGALSLAGFALGAWIGTRLGPKLLPDGSSSPYAPVFALAGAVVAGAILAAGFEGVASRLRMGMRLAPGLRTVDGLLGAVLTGALGLLIAWVVGTIALQTPGARSLRSDFQRSEILSRLNTVLPSRTLLNTLARFDPFPRVAGPGIDVAPPRAAIARDQDVRRAGRGVVRILGTACGLGVQGSGWVAAPGIVVTNAHVVAGQEDTEIQPGGSGGLLRAHAVHFDARNDLAVLRVPGLGSPSIAIAPDPDSGADGAILGFPEDGPFDVRAARLGPTRRVVTQDAYGRGPVQRQITSLRGTVRSGNSGGPVVDGRGRVLTTVFAATTRSPRGGYGVPNSIVRRALRDTSRTVSTGPCAR